MAWGRKKLISMPRGGTTAWNTAGETASIKNACSRYGLTEMQVMAAGIPCQWRSCHGNSYAVVKLSDVAKLKATIVEEEKQAEKAKMIEEMGEEAYNKHVADQKAQKIKKQFASKLVPMLSKAIAASGNGVADSIENITIGKTAAKTEWYLKPNEIEMLTPVEADKKIVKFNLSDVIAAAHNKSERDSGKGGHISTRVKNFPEREKLYARYLFDQFNNQCSAVGDDDVVQNVYNQVRVKMEKEIKVKKDELKLEETRFSAFTKIVGDMASGGGKKRAAEGNTEATTAGKENNENHSQSPAKKQKATEGSGPTQNVEPVKNMEQ